LLPLHHFYPLLQQISLPPNIFKSVSCLHSESFLHPSHFLTYSLHSLFSLEIMGLLKMQSRRHCCGWNLSMSLFISSIVSCVLSKQCWIDLGRVLCLFWKPLQISCKRRFIISNWARKTPWFRSRWITSPIYWMRGAMSGATISFLMASTATEVPIWSMELIEEENINSYSQLHFCSVPKAEPRYRSWYM
jgi:hypothetical protein